MPQLSKGKFIILALIIILITVFAVIYILSNNNKQISNNDNEIVKEPSISNVDDNKNNEKDNQEVVNNQEDKIDSQEEEIDTQTSNEVFANIQKRIEVVTDNNSKLIFNNMFTPTKSEIETFMGIDLNLFDSYMIRMSESKFSGEMYMVFKPFADNKEDAKIQIKKFLLSYESAWEKLNEEQYNLIVNRTAIERNGYLVYIISIENNIIMNEIRSFI